MYLVGGRDCELRPTSGPAARVGILDTVGGALSDPRCPAPHTPPAGAAPARTLHSMLAWRASKRLRGAWAALLPNEDVGGLSMFGCSGSGQAWAIQVRVFWQWAGVRLGGWSAGCCSAGTYGEGCPNGSFQLPVCHPCPGLAEAPGWFTLGRWAGRGGAL